MQHHLPVVIEQDEDGIFIVSVPTLQGCHTYGHTIEEAMKNIAEASVFCLQDEAPNRSVEVIEYEEQEGEDL